MDFKKFENIFIAITLFCLVLYFGFVYSAKVFGQEAPDIPIEEEYSEEEVTEEIAEEESEEVEEVEDDIPVVDKKKSEREFRRAYRLLAKNKVYPAAIGFHKYLSKYGEEGPQYEWAQLFLGESLQRLGYNHAAVHYYYLIAKKRSNPELFNEVLKRLENISKYREHSSRLIKEDLLYKTDFGNVPNDAKNWVYFNRGLIDLKLGNRAWANNHFKKVEVDSYYGYKLKYVLAVEALDKFEDDKALILLKEVVDSYQKNHKDLKLKNDALLGLARLYFDRSRFEKALIYYDQVEFVDYSYEQARLLSEKSWALLGLKKYREALGILHALEAPAFQGYYVPDLFLLRGLIFKDLCQFIESKRAARGFSINYDATLRGLRARLPIAKIGTLLRGGTQRGDIADLTNFLKSLERERSEIVQNKKLRAPLIRDLSGIYDREKSESLRLWEKEFKREGDAIALAFLEGKEEIDVLDYEIGLEIVRRLKIENLKYARDIPLKIPVDSKKVYYEFDGEFWNDEIFSYSYYIKNRCLEENEIIEGNTK